MRPLEHATRPAPPALSLVLTLARLVRRLSTLCGMVAAACLASACVVVCQMVFVRRVLGESTVWQTEFVTYAVVAATLVGSPYVLALRGHVNVDLLGRALGTRGRRALDSLAALIGIAFCATLAASGWRYFYETWAEGWVNGRRRCGSSCCRCRSASAC